MIRQIIKIDEEKCNGCGLCIPGCQEGALQIIDGKCRLVSDLFCDGVGACIGHCPEGALTIEEREAEEYDESKVMDLISKQGANTIAAHLKHLKEHNCIDFYEQALEYLKIHSIQIPDIEEKKGVSDCGGGCPGSMMLTFDKQVKEVTSLNMEQNIKSELEQWPIQLHLVNPLAPYFKGKELAILSSCSAFTTPNIHPDYIAGRSVVIACPKLDYTEPYTKKLADIIRINNIEKAIVLRMEVPCCGGLSKIAVDAAEMSGSSKIQIEEHLLSLKGDFLKKSVIYN